MSEVVNVPDSAEKYPTFWPKLYKKSSKNAEQEWQISVVPVTLPFEVIPPIVVADIVTKHGQVDGAIQTATVRIDKGKNLGKKNATTAVQQALSEAESKWKKQLDKGYSEQRGGNAEKVELLPMLAHKYEDHKDKVDFASAFVQPKLDGVRAIAIRKGDSIILLSRQGKEHKGLDHIRKALLEVMPDDTILDGELYKHGLKFQDLLSLVKKPQAKSEEVNYHVYDMVSDFPFEDRSYAIALALDPQGTESNGPEPAPCLVQVPTLRIKDHAEVAAYHQHWVERGFEGIMLRWSDEPYKSGYRSKHLLKVKAFQDEEFEIVDVVPGVGKEADKGTFVCKTKDGATFNCRPRGRDDQRAEYLAKKSEFIGKQLTVEFFEWTTSNPPVPRFPVGKAVRDDIEVATQQAI